MVVIQRQIDLQRVQLAHTQSELAHLTEHSDTAVGLVAEEHHQEKALLCVHTEIFY